MIQERFPDNHHTLTPIRVLLADDHDLVRAGLRTLLHEMGMQVVDEASNGNEALRLVEMHKPDVVLMDIAMPEVNGLEATARLTEEFPMVRVIILSMHANAEYARRALRAGAAGYLLKNSRAPELELAIKAVVQGEIYLTPKIAKFVTANYASASKVETRTVEHFTPRQIEILQFIAKGYTRKQIAERLNISPKTFDTHRAELMRQLKIYDTAGLVRYATRMGLLTPDE